jgi:hypothetical protein
MDMGLQSLVIGVFATIAIDIWASALKFGLHLPTTDWAMVGRWFGHMPGGRLIHRPIGVSPPIRHELAIGWVAHYIIGILYAFLYLCIMRTVLSKQVSLASAVVFGLTTVLAPWLVLQPGLGLGVFASRAPRPNLIRIISLSVHLVFGASLYLGWWITEYLLLFGTQ